MRRATRAAVLAVATLTILAASAGAAFGFPGVSYRTRCSNCHNGAGVNPVATEPLSPITRYQGRT